MKPRRPVLYGFALLSLMLLLAGCSKPLYTPVDSSDSTSENEPIVSEASSSKQSNSAEVVLPTFQALEDLSDPEKESLSKAVSDVCHFNFDVTKDDPHLVIYQGIIGPGASSFWNIHSTGDSEEDYRLFVKEDGQDPLRLFRSYGKFPAKDVDFILTNFYNMQPSHDPAVYEEVMYYYEDFYYVQWIETGYDPHDVKLLSLKSTAAHTYEVAYEIYDVSDPSFLMISGTLTLKYQAVEEVPRWTYLKSQMEYAGYDEDIGEPLVRPESQ